MLRPAPWREDLLDRADGVLPCRGSRCFPLVQSRPQGRVEKDAGPCGGDRTGRSSRLAPHEFRSVSRNRHVMCSPWAPTCCQAGLVSRSSGVLAEVVVRGRSWLPVLRPHAALGSASLCPARRRSRRRQPSAQRPTLEAPPRRLGARGVQGSPAATETSTRPRLP